MIVFDKRWALALLFPSRFIRVWKFSKTFWLVRFVWRSICGSCFPGMKYISESSLKPRMLVRILNVNSMIVKIDDFRSSQIDLKVLYY